MTNQTGFRPPRVGIVGAGQLARMTYQAGIPLGLSPRLLAARPDDGAALIAREFEVGPPDSIEALRAFAAGCDVVTFDHELVNAEGLAAIEAAGGVCRPSAAVMATVQDKSRQRTLFDTNGLPSPAWQRVRSAEEIAAFADRHGWPVVAKACRGGYDGRGVWVLPDRPAADRLVAETAGSGIELLVEAHVAIDRELAVLIARRPSGEMATYPIVETVQIAGICHELRVPAPIPPEMAAEAGQITRTVAEALGVVGILAVELFQSGDRIIVNEMATRPHNSGHFSIEGCRTSQFENHLRAVLDWPLGVTTPTAPAVVTVNVLGGPRTGDLLANLPEALAVPGAHVHLYGKESRPGRKIGHVTALGDTIDAARAVARRAARLLAGESPEGEIA